MSWPQPYGPAPQPYQRPVPQVGLPPPVAVEIVPGTPYAVAVLGVAPTVSGITCGVVGLVLTGTAMALSVVLTIGA